MRRQFFKKRTNIIRRTKRQMLVMQLKQLVAIVPLIINSALVIHLFSMLTMADKNNTFLHFFDSSTEIFVAPFQNMIPNLVLGSGSVIDTATLIAIVFFTLLAWVLIKIINAAFPETVSQNYEADIESLVKGDFHQ